MKTISGKVKHVLPRLGALTLALAGLTSYPAHAFQFGGDGDFAGSLNTTISYGTRWRVEDRDPAIIGVANGGTAHSVNGDDGNLNFDRGLIANIVSRVIDLFRRVL